MHRKIMLILLALLLLLTVFFHRVARGGDYPTEREIIAGMRASVTEVFRFPTYTVARVIFSKVHPNLNIQYVKVICYATHVGGPEHIKMVGLAQETFLEDIPYGQYRMVDFYFKTDQPINESVIFYHAPWWYFEKDEEE